MLVYIFASVAIGQSDYFGCVLCDIQLKERGAVQNAWVVVCYTTLNKTHVIIAELASKAD